MLFSQYVAENPLMDIRMRKGVQKCNGTSGELALWLDMRTTDGSQRIIKQSQNSVMFDPVFTAQIDSVKLDYSVFDDDNYVVYWRYVASQGVLEYQVAHKVFMPYTQIGGPTSDDWHPAFCFHIYFRNHVSDSGRIDYYIDTPHYNVRAAKIPLDGTTETIHRYELDAPLTIDLPCRTDIRVDCQALPPVLPFMGSTTFEILVQNLDSYTANSVVIENMWSDALLYESNVTSYGTFDPQTGLWNLGDLEGNSSALLTLVMTGSQPGTFFNSASLLQMVQDDPSPENNFSTGEVIVEPPAMTDLALTCSVDRPAAFRGDTLSMKIRLSNSGPDDATGITVLDTLPPGLKYINHSGGGFYNVSTGEWTISELLVTSFRELDLNVLADSIGTFTNIAQIVGHDQLDSDSSNNLDYSVVDIFPNSDIQVVVTVDQTPRAENDPFIFSVVARNNGPHVATHLVFENELSEGVHLIQHTGDGSYSVQTGSWSLDSLAVDSSATLSLTCSASGFGDFTCSSRIVDVDQMDSCPENNSDLATVSVLETSDLVLSSMTSKSNMTTRDFFNLVVTIENNGPSPASGIQVVDLLPAGLTLIVTNVTQGYFDQDMNIWYAGDLPVGYRGSLVFTCGADQEGLWSNGAHIRQMDQFDPDLSTNYDFATFNVIKTGFFYPDLNINVSAGSDSIAINETAQFFVTVRNQGHGPAESVRVNSLLHRGFELLNVTPPQGSFNPQTGEWFVGDLPEGAEIQLEIPVRATMAGYLTHYCAVRSIRPGEANFNDNETLAFINVCHQDGNGVDLQLQNVFSDVLENPQVGDTVQYTLTVRNNSANETASDVRILNRLTPGLDFLNAIPAVLDYNAGRGEWKIDTLTPGQGFSINITAGISRSGDMTNSAFVSGSGNNDFGPENNNQEWQIYIPPSAGVEVYTAVNRNVLCAQDTVQFEVNIVNHGPDAATNISVTNAVPAGFLVLSGQPEAGTYDPLDGSWNIAGLSSADSVTLILTAVADSPGVWTQQSVITAVDQADPDISDNRQFNTVHVVDYFKSYPDVVLQQSISQQAVNPGDLVLITQTVQNDGPGRAESVQTIDLPHQNYEIIHQEMSLGEYNNVRGLWTVGGLEEGETAELILTARAIEPGQSAHYSALTHVSPGDTSLNNNQNVVNFNIDGSTQPTADLEILTQLISVPETPTLGDNIEVQITLINASTDSVRDVDVVSRLPAGVKYTGSVASLGSFNPWSGVWKVGSIDGNSSQTLTVSLEVTSSGHMSICAFIDQSDNTDADLTNNKSCVMLSVAPTKVFARIYLEGPYRFAVTDPDHPDPEFMATELRHPYWFGGQNLLPVRSPYADSTIVTANTSVPNDMPVNIVDWLYLQFRPADCDSCAEHILGHGYTGVSCLLRRDGALLDALGREGVVIPQLPQGLYFIVVEHRNHLKVMSALPVDTKNLFEYNFDQPVKNYYDFTEAKNQFYTLNDDMQRGCRLEPVQGKWVVAAGDGDKGHQIESNDYDFWFRHNTLGVGYHRADYDCGGLVEGRDESLQYDNNMVRSPFSWPTMRP